MFAGLPLDRPLIMGVVNVTPDSFSDGGEAATVAAAIERGHAMVGDGADIIDVGGESTRPGAAPVPLEEELARVIPVITALGDAGCAVSIDTRHAAVMAAAIDAGAKIVNDVTALCGDPRSLDVVAGSAASVILMHMQGEPGTMQNAPQYEDAAQEVRDYLAGRIEVCVKAGIAIERIAIDPGIGFGKTLKHNLDILNRLALFTGLGCPLVLGVSRKSFIGKISGDDNPKGRLGGSLAAALAGVTRGVAIVRVHDVAETRQALAVWQAINSPATF